MRRAVLFVLFVHIIPFGAIYAASLDQITTNLGQKQNTTGNPGKICKALKICEAGKKYMDGKICKAGKICEAGKKRMAKYARPGLKLKHRLLN